MLLKKYRKNGEINADFHLVPYGQIKKARSSNHRPFPANNKYLEVDFTNFKGISKNNLVSAIASTCNRMLNPPANLKGVNGIAKFSKEILKWKNFDAEKLKRAGVTNYFQINADGGTGGGLFRGMFGSFLIEAAPIVENTAVFEVGNEFIKLAARWDTIAAEMWRLHETGDAVLLEEISENIAENLGIETRLLIRLQGDLNSLK